MPKRTDLPLAEIVARVDASDCLSGYVSETVKAKWSGNIKAIAAENAIDIYHPIGVDYWTGQDTLKMVSEKLAMLGGADVVININSPGGDVWQGISIYNLLRQYAGQVTIRIIGLAASAASIVAMAGDTIEIADSAFLMIHNAWVGAAGDKNALMAVVEVLQKIDVVMAGIYAAKTGKPVEEIAAMLDAETWIDGGQAVAMGLADSILGAEFVPPEAEEPSADFVSGLASLVQVTAQLTTAQTT